jgi:hypothetical protein
MDVRENHQHAEPFEAFKRAALHSLLWGCSGSFLLGVAAGLLLFTVIA